MWDSTFTELIQLTVDSVQQAAMLWCIWTSLKYKHEVSMKTSSITFWVSELSISFPTQGCQKTVISVVYKSVFVRTGQYRNAVDATVGSVTMDGNGLAHTVVQLKSLIMILDKATSTIFAALTAFMGRGDVTVHLFKLVHRRQSIRNWGILML